MQTFNNVFTDPQIAGWIMIALCGTLVCLVAAALPPFLRYLNLTVLGQPIAITGKIVNKRTEFVSSGRSYGTRAHAGGNFAGVHINEVSVDIGSERVWILVQSQAQWTDYYTGETVHITGRKAWIGKRVVYNDL